LVGAMLGAGLVNYAESYFTVAAPEYWLFVLGGLFVVVTLLFPEGVIGTLARLRLPRARVRDDRAQGALRTENA
jgi:urea transport system permease protein